MTKIKTPLVGFVAHSGTGKTTLLIKLIAIFAEQGINVGTIKHAHHTFDIDQPGKDSYKLRQAGASEVLIASSNRWALIADAGNEQKFSFQDHLLRMDQDNLDLVLVEGFKFASIPKIELVRSSLGKDLFFPHDANIIAVATDKALPMETHLPLLDINNPEQMVTFIYERIMNTDKSGCKNEGEQTA